MNHTKQYHQKCQITIKRIGLRLCASATTYLKMEMSHSQECVGNAMKKQIAANAHATTTIPIASLDTF